MIVTEVENKYAKKIEQLEEERDEALQEKENLEAEINTLREQVDLLTEINKDNDTEISKLKEQIDNNDSSPLIEDLKRIEEEKQKKSLLADQLELELSNIDKEKNEILQEKGQLSDRLSKTLDEYSALAAKNEALMSSIQSLQDEKNTLKMEHADDLQHIKGTLFTFLQSTPMTPKENESVLSVVFSMLQVSPAEIRQIEATRKKNFSAPEKKNSGKGGIFGMFGKK